MDVVWKCLFHILTWSVWDELSVFPRVSNSNAMISRGSLQGTLIREKERTHHWKTLCKIFQQILYFLHTSVDKRKTDITSVFLCLTWVKQCHKMISFWKYFKIKHICLYKILWRCRKSAAVLAVILRCCWSQVLFLTPNPLTQCLLPLLGSRAAGHVHMMLRSYKKRISLQMFVRKILTQQTNVPNKA